MGVVPPAGVADSDILLFMTEETSDFLRLHTDISNTSGKEKPAIVTEAIGLANDVFRRFSLPEIEPEGVLILPDKEYREKIVELAEADAHPDFRGDYGDAGSAKAPPNADGVFLSEGYVKALEAIGGVHAVAGGIAHEQEHRVELDNRKSITPDEAKLLAGSQAMEYVRRRFREYKIEFLAAGPGMEVRTEGKLLGPPQPLNLWVSEFTANIAQYAVVTRGDPPYSCKEIAAKILYPTGWWEHDGALPGENPERKIVRIFGLLFAKTLSDASVATLIQRARIEPEKFVDTSPWEVNWPTYRSLIRGLRGEGKDGGQKSLGVAFKGLTTWKGTRKSEDVQELCKFLRSGL